MLSRTTAKLARATPFRSRFGLAASVRRPVASKKVPTTLTLFSGLEAQDSMVAEMPKKRTARNFHSTLFFAQAEKELKVRNRVWCCRISAYIC